MRYLLHQTQYSELQARQAYLYDAFHMYFLPGKPEGEYIPLMPLGSRLPDVLFITGHADLVCAYLESAIKGIPEKTIVITTCFGKAFKKYTANKTIYVPSVTEKYCYFRDGAVYGFGFDISDAELDFYNTSGDVMDRVKQAYIKL